MNMLSAARAWIEQGSLSPALGLWWVHGAMLLLALVMLGVQNSVHRRLLS
jgi:lipopolysaccharide export system permease protein